MTGCVPMRDQVDCIVREIKMRERVYPRWVQAGRLTQAEADRQLRLMRAVLATLREQPGSHAQDGLL